MNIYKEFPEIECANNGDPYFVEIIHFDDGIDCMRFDNEDELWATYIERCRLDFETMTLSRWLERPSPRIH